MYIPSFYNNNNTISAHNFIRQNPFALVISAETGLQATHLPLILFNEGDSPYLLGHLAKLNPQAKIRDNSDVLAVFSGENAYISASIYNDNEDVPTWNYFSCHVFGTWQRLRSMDEVEQTIATTVKYFEKSNPSPWTINDVCPHMYQSLIKQVVAFKIHITKIDFAEKLNQEKNSTDRASVIEHLLKNPSNANPSLAKRMEELAKS